MKTNSFWNPTVTEISLCPLI